MHDYWINTESRLDCDQILQIRLWARRIGQSHRKTALSEGDDAHQRLSREHLQERNEIVSISEVLVQVSDMSLGLGTQEDTWRLCNIHFHSSALSISGG